MVLTFYSFFSNPLRNTFVLGFLLVLLGSCQTAKTDDDNVSTSKDSVSVPGQTQEDIQTQKQVTPQKPFKTPLKSDVDKLPGSWELIKFEVYINNYEKKLELDQSQFKKELGFSRQVILFTPNNQFSSKSYKTDGSLYQSEDGDWRVNGRELIMDVLKPAPSQQKSSYVIRENKLYMKTLVDFDNDGEADDLILKEASRMKEDR